MSRLDDSDPERAGSGDGAVAPTRADAGGLGEWARALLESEDTYHLVFARERDAMSLFDAETKRFLSVNDAWCALYGYSREEARAMTPLDVSAETQVTLVAIDRVTGGGEASASPQLRWHRKKDGTVFPVELVCGSLQLGGRRAVYAVMRDVSERVAAEDALRRSEQGFRTLIESLPDAIVVHRDGEVIYANPAALALTGHDPGTDLRGTAALDLVHPDDRTSVGERLCRAAPSDAVTFFPERLVRRDGTIVDAEIASLSVTYEGAGASLAIGRDVTERKRMERRLVSSDRLASLGRLAASVGHEINNPLAWMIGNLELALRDLAALEGTLAEPTRARLLDRIDAISEGAQRIRVIVRDLKTLSRDEGEPHRAVDLHRSLDLCAQMAGPEIRHRARLVRAYHPEPIHVRGSEARVGQVFLNLIVNAAQAIPEGAVHENEVVVRTTRRAVPDGGALAVVEVEDTGRGIAEDALERVFEPFFTTKTAGAGTGLGLAISHHVVTAMGGRIEVERRAAGGTRFRVIVPACEDDGADGPPTGSRRALPAEHPGTRRGRILVVDDQPDMAAVIASSLWDHDVAIAHSGREALAMIAAGERFDVVVCDLMMGDLTGMDVHEQLARDRPGTEEQIVLVSGGAHTERARAFLARVTNPFLEKPFAVEALREVVRRMLETHRAR